ncbi:MAG TPA: hypothetical protein VIO61_11450 [Anaerolineaceae bacterium]
MKRSLGSWRKYIRVLARIAFLPLLLLGCIPGFDQTGRSATPSPTQQHQVTPTPKIPLAEVLFEVNIPAPLTEGQDIYLDILDEVTGLALNMSHYKMQAKDRQNYSIKLPIAVDSVIKYRYSREGGTSVIEYNAQNQQVRYRLLSVTNPMVVKDAVVAWTDLKYTGRTGRIQGRVLDSEKQTPIAGVLLVSGGVQTLTSSDGSFLLEGVPAGNQNLVAMSIDGNYRLFQQGAVIAPDSTTPANIDLIPSSMVKITLNVTTPKNSLPRVPVRIIGNTYSLGNTFADLKGGINAIASRAPVLTYQSENRYSITLNLPAGWDLRYKYTLGDGFWNAEHTNDGKFVVRQLIVPNKDSIFEETIESWASPGSAPVSFSVKVPENTPASDTISIQFNPYGWTEPIPMWSQGNNHWTYILYSPLNMLGNVGYRYCRNEQCGYADDDATKGPKSQGYPFTSSPIPQNFEDDVRSWTWIKTITGSTTVSQAEIAARQVEFFAGVELLPRYHPSYQAYYGWAFQTIHDIGANYTILTPTWQYSFNTPPILESIPGKNPLWQDSTHMIIESQQKGLRAAVYPIPDYGGDPEKWWESAKRDSGWWQTWFSQYRTFLLHHADLAAQTGAGMLIIGDPYMQPAYPNGKLFNNNPSGVPANAEDQWRQIIADIRSRYKGTLAWGLSYSSTQSAPKFLSDVDLLYVMITSPFASTTAATPAPDLSSQVAKWLDNGLIPLRDSFKKPIIIGLKYPSASGVTSGCIKQDAGCTSYDSLDQPFVDIPAVSIDLQAQANIYNAFFAAAAPRAWITGIVSRGFYPPVLLRDKSSSIYGKPAADVAWYWFPLIRGKK